MILDSAKMILWGMVLDRPTPSAPYPTWTPETRVPGGGKYRPDWQPPESTVSFHVPGWVWGIIFVFATLAIVTKGFGFLGRGGGLLTRTSRLQRGYGGRLRIGPGRGERFGVWLASRIDAVLFLAVNAAFVGAVIYNVRG